MTHGLTVQASTHAESVAFDSLDPPAQFKAKKLQDGRVLVEDVPVFAETEARYTPDGKLYAPPIGLPWLKGAFEAFQRKPGYWAPLHGDHHSGGVLEGVKDRERFGEFRARSVRLMRVDGKLKWAFTADYLFDDEEKAKRSNRFPYQSVEIVNEKPDEINSVALLSDKAPFVRFPNRRLAFSAGAGEPLCYATSGEGRSAFVWKSAAFGGLDGVEFAPETEPSTGSGPFTKTLAEIERKEPAPADPSAVGAPVERETPKPDPRAVSSQNTAAFAAEEDSVEDEKKPDAKPPVAAESAAPAADYAKCMAAIEELKKGQADMAAMMSKMMGASAETEKKPEVEAAAGGDGGTIDEERKEAAPEKKPMNAPVVAAQVQLAAELDTVKAKLEALERSKKHDELFAGYAARLEPFGLTTGRKQRLESFLANDIQFGTTFAEQYVKDTEAREKRVSRPATERGPSATTSDPATGDLPAELRAYAAQGTAALTWAQSKLAEFRALEAAGCTGDMTLAAFVKQSAESAPRGN